MPCEYCGGSLSCYECEWFCPDCTRYEVEQLAEEALDEALRLRASEAAAAAADAEPADDPFPF